MVTRRRLASNTGSGSWRIFIEKFVVKLFKKLSVLIGQLIGVNVANYQFLQPIGVLASFAVALCPARASILTGMI